jgi:uncharacterized repeat protein (TIGR03803 family)
MKKVIIFFSFCIVAITSSAQAQLYGITFAGGANGYGVIFQWSPITNNYTKKIDFIGSNGREPRGSLTESNGKFYGTTYYGGINGTSNFPYYGYGVIFEWNPITNIYTKKIDFDESSGFYPTEFLTLKDGKFYGTTTHGGGASSGGTIFEWDPVTNVYTKKIDFDYSNGGSPNGSLVFYSGKFYGRTTASIFEWDPLTNIYTKKIDFNGINGDPHAEDGTSLALYAGKFYGTTCQGGINNGGVLFEWDPLTNIYTKKIDFESSNGTGGVVTSNGSWPIGSLVLQGGKFYGMTVDGGSYPYLNYGVIFEWDPITNIYIKRTDFDYFNGANPKGSLSLSGGKFYGTTSFGGVNDAGVIFELDPVTNIYTKKTDFDIVNGARGIASLIEYGNTPLPIKLLSFTASLQNTNTTSLQWQIATAEDGSKYELQRSIDSRSYTTVNLQTGTSSGTRFAYTDNALASGTYYYRLKITDKDGKVLYSNTAVIKVGSKEQSILVYPNPVIRGQSMQLTLQNITSTSIEIINAAGQIVYNNTNKQNGSFSLPLSSLLPSGYYTLKIISKDKITTQKLSIQ